METTRVDGVRLRYDAGSAPGSGNVKSHSASRCGFSVRPSSSFFWRSFSRDWAWRTILTVPWPNLRSVHVSEPRRGDGVHRLDGVRTIPGGRRKSPRDEVLNLGDVALLRVIFPLLLVVPDATFAHIRVVVARVIVELLRVLVEPA